MRYNSGEYTVVLQKCCTVRKNTQYTGHFWLCYEEPSHPPPPALTEGLSKTPSPFCTFMTMLLPVPPMSPKKKLTVPTCTIANDGNNRKLSQRLP